MNFELKPLANDRVDFEKCDALIVLVASGQLGTAFLVGKGASSVLAAMAIKSGDFDTKVGKLLSCYRPVGILASRLILCGVGDGSPKNLRTAVLAAFGSLKGSDAAKVVLSLGTGSDSSGQAVRAAVVACGDAGYTYRTTKPTATAAKLATVVIGVASAAQAKRGFVLGTALVNGLDFAKEWANRPSNHATPALLANAAKVLGKYPKFKVDVLGPKEVAKLGMGSFAAVAQGAAEPLRFIVMR